MWGEVGVGVQRIQAAEDALNKRGRALACDVRKNPPVFCRSDFTGTGGLVVNAFAIGGHLLSVFSD